MIKDFLSYLLSLETQGIKLGLDRTHNILSACGHPQNDLKIIQVVGTNGKGSTSAMIANIFKQANYKVGLYTSPHLYKINERIRVNGQSISDNSIIKFINIYQKQIKRFNISFFEAMTALALWYFHSQKVDIAILETGLGGRLDSVSACTPELVVFTPISLDHQHILGDTIQEIAIEKAGAIKKGVPCISSNQKIEVKKIFNSYAKKLHTQIDYINIDFECSVSLNGQHQKMNAALAAESAQYLKTFNINKSDIIQGLSNVKWPARIQKINNQPLTFFDVAHNETSFLHLCNYINKLNINKNKILIIALQKHKHLHSAIEQILHTFDLIVITQTNTRNFLSTQSLNKLFNSNKTQIITNPKHAIQQYSESNEGCVVIAGSHYLGPIINKIFKISFENI